MNAHTLANAAPNGLWAIVPVKGLGTGKTRLSGVLDSSARQELTRQLVLGTLRALRGCQALSGWIVVSPDVGALMLAAEWGGVVVRERPSLAAQTSDKDEGSEVALNAALRQARVVACGLGAQALLVLPSDLPLLTGSALDALIKAHCLHRAPGETGALTIAPSRDGQGTNALVITPPLALQFAFGRHSYSLHQEQAQAVGLAVRRYTDETIAFDLDTPADLDELRQLSHPRAAALLAAVQAASAPAAHPGLAVVREYR